MNKIFIIHPKDESTDFLHCITRYLKLKFANRVLSARLGDKENSRRMALKKIRDYTEKGHFIVFLGHGRSNALLGANNPLTGTSIFIDNSTVSGSLSNSRILCLACRSTEFLKTQEVEGIGFMNLLTEQNEVYTARQNNGLAYQGITEEHINEIRKELVRIMKYALEDFIEYSRTLEYLHKNILLRFNKRIATHIYMTSSENIEEIEPFINALREARDGMRYQNMVSSK